MPALFAAVVVIVIFNTLGTAHAQYWNGLPTPAVNPANQEAARVLQTQLDSYLTPKVRELPPCYVCGIENRYGVNLLRIRATQPAQPPATCNALPGPLVTCSLTGATLQIDGTWIVGDYTWAAYYNYSQPRGTPLASGTYWMSVRNFSPAWTGTFTQSLYNIIIGRPLSDGFTQNALSFTCDRNDTAPAGAQFQFGITRTSGTLTRQIYSFVESLARKEVVNYFCTAMHWASAGSYFANLGTALQQRMTFQNVAPSEWID